MVHGQSGGKKLKNTPGNILKSGRGLQFNDINHNKYPSIKTKPRRMQPNGLSCGVLVKIVK
jgi:hypothetical protein